MQIVELPDELTVKNEQEAILTGTLRHDDDHVIRYSRRRDVAQEWTAMPDVASSC